MSKPYGKNYENATIEDYEDLMAEERNCINKELEAKRNARAFPDMAAQFESHYQYLFNLEKAIADRRWELDKQYPAETARIKAKVEAAELSKKIDKELQEYLLNSNYIFGQRTSGSAEADEYLKKLEENDV